MGRLVTVLAIPDKLVTATPGQNLIYFPLGPDIPHNNSCGQLGQLIRFEPWDYLLLKNLSRNLFNPALPSLRPPHYSSI